MKPFLFSHAEKEAAGARELTDAELEIVAGASGDADAAMMHTQVMTANADGSIPMHRDGYDD